MTLDLNETQPFRDFRDEEKGIVRYVQQMPLLVAGETDEAGNVIDVPREPFEVADVFERRISSPKPVWMNNWFDTGTGLLVPVKGSYDSSRFKIRHKSESLRGVNPETKLVSGGIPHDSYETASGVEFVAGNDGVIINRDMTKDEARNNPALLELLGRDEAFRDAVVERIYFEGRKKFNNPDVTLMGIYPQSEVGQAYEKAFCVLRLDNGSRLGGRDDLDDDYGRLVGKAPEVPNAFDRFHNKVSAEKRIITVAEFLEQEGQTSAYAPDQIRKFQKTLDQKGYAISRRK